MENRNKQNENLGVNKLGKNIRKSPLHQPNFPNPNRQQPEPQVYNINKNDFRNIVQQLTGPGSPELSNIPSPNNPPKPPSERLQRIRPPPLSSVTRPPLPIPMPSQPNSSQAGVYNNNSFIRPPAQSPAWPNNTAESPVSAYMRYLQNSMVGTGLTPTQPQNQSRPPSQEQPPGPPPPARGFSPLPSPRGGGFPPLPSSQGGGFPPLPSPTSQFPFPSPGFFNFSPLPMLSPGYQFPPPLSPNFAFSGPGPHPPLSPGIAFPSSPSGFFPFPSPTWRGQ